MLNDYFYFLKITVSYHVFCSYGSPNYSQVYPTFPTHPPPPLLHFVLNVWSSIGEQLPYWGYTLRENSLSLSHASGGILGPTPLSVLGIWSSSCLYKCMLSQPVWVHRHSCPAVFPSGLRAMQPYFPCTLTTFFERSLVLFAYTPHTPYTPLSLQLNHSWSILTFNPSHQCIHLFSLKSPSQGPLSNVLISMAMFSVLYIV